MRKRFSALWGDLYKYFVARGNYFRDFGMRRFLVAGLYILFIIGDIRYCHLQEIIFGMCAYFCGHWATLETFKYLHQYIILSRLKIEWNSVRFDVLEPWTGHVLTVHRHHSHCHYSHYISLGISIEKKCLLLFSLHGTLFALKCV